MDFFSVWFWNFPFWSYNNIRIRKNFLALSVVSAKSNILNVFRNMKRSDLKDSMIANDNLWTDNDSSETDRYEDWLRQADFQWFESAVTSKAVVLPVRSLGSKQVMLDLCKWLKSWISNSSRLVINDVLVISVGGNTNFQNNKNNLFL